MRWIHGWWLLGCALLIAGSCARPAYQHPQARKPHEDPQPIVNAPRAKNAPAEVQSPLDSLAPSVRAAIRAQMFEHGQNLENLIWSALMLQYDSIDQIAKWIVAGQNSQVLRQQFPDLPEDFLLLREKMQQAAGELSTYAVQRNSDGVAAATGRILEACVQCHAAYLWSHSPSPPR